MIKSATVLCTTCGMPGRVVFGDDDKIKDTFFVCECQRTRAEEEKKEVVVK